MQRGDMNETEDVTYMRRALQLAQMAADVGEVPVGAVVVRQGHIIGEGYNRCIAAHDPTAHAEIQAMRAAAKQQGNYRLPGCTLYVTLEPCTMCWGAMIHARVDRLVYGATEPRAGVVDSAIELSKADFYNHTIAIDKGVLLDECATLLRDFFAQKRRLR